MADTPNPTAGTPPTQQAESSRLDRIEAALEGIVKHITAPAAQAAPAAPAPTQTAKSASLEDITRLLDARDAKRDVSARKQAYIDSKMANLPARFRTLGDDPQKWADEEQELRAEYQEMLKAAGVTAPPVGGAAAAAAQRTPISTQQTVDISKMTNTQLIDMGLKSLGAPTPGAMIAAPAATPAN